MEKNQNGYPTPALPSEVLPNAVNNHNESVQLAMVYAPDQEFRQIYVPEIALARGTLFSELDKPLRLGGEKR